MQLQTTWKFNATPAQLWPLLFQSKMDERKPCYFLFGLPKPVECRLTDGIGGVGATRECVSDKGLIRQTILEWMPEKKLRFEMRETSIYFGPCVDAIVETFVLTPAGTTETTITRTTEFTLKPGARLWVSIPMWVGLKSIHRYVFRNWKNILLTGRR
ncbi:MAG: SRPBCC family protein [Niabella sp.]|nr:SRPBCC family protein [Niabella sp.]